MDCDYDILSDRAHFANMLRLLARISFQSAPPNFIVSSSTSSTSISTSKTKQSKLEYEKHHFMMLIIEQCKQLALVEYEKQEITVLLEQEQAAKLVAENLLLQVEAKANAN